MAEAKLDRLDLEDHLMKGALLCRVICEILGGPKEHVEKTIKLLIEKIREDESDMVLINHKIFPVKPQDELFSTFAEMDVLFKKKSTLIDFCYKYMPSSIEVVEPEQIIVNNEFFSAFLNDLQARLHATDRVAKEAEAMKTLMQRRQASIIRYNLLSHLKEKPRTRDALHSLVGIDKATFNQFVDTLIKRGELMTDGDKLRLTDLVKFNDTEESS